jgi:hypothetical protein
MDVLDASKCPASESMQSFTPVVDNFGIKYMHREDIDHFIKCIKENYELTKDWDGDLYCYCGIRLKWDYNARTLNISVSGYIIKQLQRYKHASLLKPQHCSYAPQPNQFGSKAQRPLPPDTSPLLSNADIKHIQRIISSILYYARAVNLTVLMAQYDCKGTIQRNSAHNDQNKTTA